MAEYMQSNDRITSVCFTGHRDIDASAACFIPSALKNVLREAIARGAYRFLAGGAMGFDTIAALCVLELKNEFPHIKLELVLPCRNQAQRWNELNRSVYDMIFERADRVEYLHETYTPSCMHDRNRRLVDKADLVVAYLVHSGGGTAYTVAYALKQDKELLNLCDLQ
jgi:uncharacterized phage-like protein YoqJ